MQATVTSHQLSLMHMLRFDWSCCKVQSTQNHIIFKSISWYWGWADWYFHLWRSAVPYRFPEVCVSVALKERWSACSSLSICAIPCGHHWEYSHADIAYHTLRLCSETMPACTGQFASILILHLRKAMLLVVKEKPDLWLLAKWLKFMPLREEHSHLGALVQ